MHRLGKLTACTIAFACLVVHAGSAHAQAPQTPKVAQAARLTGPAPRIDGVIDDAAWNAAPAVTDFVQKEPHEGATPSVPTEVRILYDDEALYVAARIR